MDISTTYLLRLGNAFDIEDQRVFRLLVMQLRVIAVVFKTTAVEAGQTNVNALR